MGSEIDARWRTASYSGSNGGACVEVGDGARGVLVRDTKERNCGNDRTVLAVAPEAWSAFLRTVR